MVQVGTPFLQAQARVLHQNQTFYLLLPLHLDGCKCNYECKNHKVEQEKKIKNYPELSFCQQALRFRATKVSCFRERLFARHSRSFAPVHAPPGRRHTLHRSSLFPGIFFVRFFSFLGLIRAFGLSDFLCLLIFLAVPPSLGLFVSFLSELLCLRCTFEVCLAGLILFLFLGRFTLRGLFEKRLRASIACIWFIRLISHACGICKIQSWISRLFFRLHKAWVRTIVIYWKLHMSVFWIPLFSAHCIVSRSSMAENIPGTHCDQTC